MIDRIRIGLWWYRVVIEDEIKDEAGRGIVGQCRHLHREIALSRKGIVGSGETQNTLWHEVIHAIDYQMGTGLREGQVCSLANALEALTADNPDLMAECEQLAGKEVGQA